MAVTAGQERIAISEATATTTSSTFVPGQRVELSLDEGFSGTSWFVELPPGSVSWIFAAGEVGLMRADEQVFAAMLDGRRAQMLARGLTTATIKSMRGTIARFQEHTNEYPWTWRAQHVDEYFVDPAHPRARLKPTFSTLEARLGTLHELTRIAPVAIIAEVLNYSP
ncbi:MAG: hypothetical protein H7288_15690 [Kineosporiaceae bacterium]|nr:hypothetical protein [Aeromicrobium sp.]